MNKCNIYKRCGGCTLLHKPYEDGINEKKVMIQQLFQKEKLSGAPQTIIGMEHPYRYRNKMLITFSRVGKNTIGGFYEENTHRVIDLDECIIHSDLLNRIATFLPKLIDRLRLLAYNEDRQTGLIRHVMMKEGFTSHELMVVIVTSSEVFPARSAFVKELRQEFPMITTIIQNINSRKTSIILGDKERILYGPGWIRDTLCSLQFKITSKSFFQVNPQQTQVLYELIWKMVSGNGQDIVLDAYSGVGTIGLTLSRFVKQVICVENNPQAVRAGISNAKDNKISNVEFYCEDATVFVQDLSKHHEHIDCLVMDPPRSGSTPLFLESIIKLKPKKIIYISCEPETLVRDLKVLVHDYQIADSVAVDMFCWTKHVETVVLLNRIKE